ncbi:UDP-N-acetylglucosamine 1-carboxyvinyltransferase [Leptospira sp. GIMC2001]|uniref:UDP-N-acetylglucosamine 1-carboxyvinyltransferase n=1 Tax=Leptospira sp. GIMC2001 TaxID=1513297 RepID=UPI002349A824|nr:UDP-N-acetylglucosamine 1-carboxyvinyltransferase [Leptospira sp. GIMC2001]WCL48695.1 UDP-N-acetylglucosamine 1-carboxyvinyltransferase [Leptospira sp. GIMC2001]
MAESFFRIKGKNPISGTITPQGNKNEALPLLGAVCMIKSEVILENVPMIADVLNLIEVISHLGVEVKKLEPGRFSFRPGNNLNSDLPPELCSKLRGAVTLAGPILAMTGRVFLPRPGGDKIGRRRIDTHLLALEALGAHIEVFPDGYEIKTDKLIGKDILLDETSVTATENAVMAACFAEGRTIIRNAASEPHVQGLCRFLNSSGAKISGIGSNVLIIDSISTLESNNGEPIVHRIGSDYLEIGSFISLAALTRGELFIKDVNLSDIRMMRIVYSRLGIEIRPHEDGIIVPSGQKMEIHPDYHGVTPKIDDAPWPGFPADMTSVALVTATQCKGTVMIHEKLFESRLFFVDNIIAMGAQIILCDPHRAIVIGPNKLYGQRVASPDIRAGMAMILAALCAEGVSEIHNIIQIDRGFERIDERLQGLGADIQRIEE